MLIQQGADPNLKDKRGFRSLQMAATNGHLDTVRVLVNAGAELDAHDNEYGVTALMGAATNGHDDIVELLIQARAAVNIRAPNGMTALGFANLKGQRSAARILQEHGATD